MADTSIESIPLIHKISLLFNSCEVSALQCSVLGSMDQLVGVLQLRSGQEQEMLLTCPEKTICCHFKALSPSISQSFYFGVPPELQEPVQLFRNKQFSNFTLKTRINIDCQQADSIFPCQQQLQAFTKAHLKKIQNKVIKKLWGQKMRSQKKKKTHSKGKNKPGVTLIDCCLDRFGQTTTQTTLLFTQNRIGGQPANNRQAYTSQKSVPKQKRSIDNHQYPNNQKQSNNRISISSSLKTQQCQSHSIGLNCAKSKQGNIDFRRPNISNNYLNTIQRQSITNNKSKVRINKPKTISNSPSHKHFHKYLQQQTLTQLTNQQHTIDLVKSIITQQTSAVFKQTPALFKQTTAVFKQTSMGVPLRKTKASQRGNAKAWCKTVKWKICATQPQ